jgi:hypothetical protein
MIKIGFVSSKSPHFLKVHTSYYIWIVVAQRR